MHFFKTLKFFVRSFENACQLTKESFYVLLQVGADGGVWIQQNLHRTSHISKFVNQALLRWFTIGGLASRNLRFRSIFWLTNAGCTVVLIFWLISLSWARTTSAEDWSLNGKTTRMGSDRSLAAGEETGWSDALAAINREMVELTSLSGYFSRGNNNFSNWKTVFIKKKPVLDICPTRLSFAGKSSHFHPCHWYKKVKRWDV